MRRSALEFIGSTFGRLTIMAIEFYGKDARALCRCSCGKAHSSVLKTLRSGACKSCGCWNRDPRSKETITKHGHARGKFTPEYHSWRGMLRRCTCPTNSAWENYGGRGITVCPQWLHSYETFYQNMGPRPTLTQTLYQRLFRNFPLDRVLTTVVFLFLITSAKSQQVSFSPQGAESLKALTGQTIKGVQIIDVNVCSQGAPFAISGGELIQAAVRGGISPIAASIIPAITSKAVRNSKVSIAFNIGKELTLALPMFQAGEIFHIGARAATGLLLVHQGADRAAPYLQARIPDPKPLLDALVRPELSYKVPAQGEGCVQGFLVARYTGPAKSFEITLGGTQVTTEVNYEEMPQWWKVLHSQAQVPLLKDPRNGPGLLGV